MLTLITASQLPVKTTLSFFFRVQDQLYLAPPSVTEHTGLTASYLGALGFTKPLEQLVLHTVPLQSLLDWLFKPKGPNLVEASVAAAPGKALVLVVTKNMLYVEEPPLVGVGLMYKPHYVSPAPFSAAYVQLNVWHSAGSNKESEDKLTTSRLLFVSISEMSDVIPVAVQHPILLDVASKEAMEDTGEPMSPLSFRGFRLHTIWTQQPGGGLAHNVPFPHFLGKSISSLLEYELKKFPQGLRQGQKRVLSLKPPSTDHWNIALECVGVGLNSSSHTYG